MKLTEEINLKDDIFLQVERDKDGRQYHNIKKKKPINAVICINGENKVVKGYHRIVIRKGASKFGNEIYNQFWIIGEKKNYKANTNYSNIEFYYTEKEFIKFMRTVLSYIGNIDTIFRLV